MSESMRLMPSGVKLTMRSWEAEPGRWYAEVRQVGSGSIYLGNHFPDREGAVEEAEAWIRENRLVIGKR